MIMLPFITYTIYKERLKQKEQFEEQQEKNRIMQEKQFINNFLNEQEKRKK